MIGRVKKDLRNLFGYVDHNKYNKFWRKFLSKNTYGYDNHKLSICKGLEEIKVCYETIEKLSDVRQGYSYQDYKNDIFTAILSNPKYTFEEQEKICEDFKDKIKWIDVFDKGVLHKDLEIKYSKNIINDYKTNIYRSQKKHLEPRIKELERECKIKDLLEDEG